jgi:hypothetical protein
MKKLGIPVALFILIFGFACGDDDDDGSGGSAGGADSDAAAGSGGMDGGTSGTGGASGEGGASGSAGEGPMDSGQDGGPPAPTMEDLQGTWRGPCFTQNGSDRRVNLVFSGNAMTIQMEMYGSSNASCDNPLIAIAMEMDVALTGPSLLNPGAHQLGGTITGITATMNNADAVTYANAAGIFGITDWEVGESRDVAGMAFEPPDAGAGTDSDAGAVPDAGTGGDALPEVGSPIQLDFMFTSSARDRLRISDLGGGGGGLGIEEYVKQ